MNKWITYSIALSFALAIITTSASAYGQGMSSRFLQTDPALRAVAYQVDDLNNQADTLTAKGDWKDAESDYLKALQLIPRNVHATEALAHHAYLAGDDDNAIKLYRQCIYDGTRVYNSYSRSTMELAILLSKRGEMDEALRLYQASYHTFGDTWGHDDVPLALPNYNANNPPFSITEFQAMANVMAGINCIPDDPSGEMHLKAATELDPSSPIGYFYLGRWLKDTHTRDADAAAAYRKAWEEGNSQVDSIVLKEADCAFQPFHKAFDQAFKDVPHYSIGDDSDPHPIVINSP